MRRTDRINRRPPELPHLPIPPRTKPRCALPAELVDRSPQTCYETDQKIVALRAQFAELRDQGQGCSCPAGQLVWITCPCGSRLALYAAFRCAECGFYLCKACARRHFNLDMVVNTNEAAQAAALEDTHG